MQINPSASLPAIATKVPTVVKWSAISLVKSPLVLKIASIVFALFSVMIVAIAIYLYFSTKQTPPKPPQFNEQQSNRFSITTSGTAPTPQTNSTIEPISFLANHAKNREAIYYTVAAPYSVLLLLENDEALALPTEAKDGENETLTSGKKEVFAENVLTLVAANALKKDWNNLNQNQQKTVKEAVLKELKNKAAQPDADHNDPLSPQKRDQTALNGDKVAQAVYEQILSLGQTLSCCQSYTNTQLELLAKSL